MGHFAFSARAVLDGCLWQLGARVMSCLASNDVGELVSRMDRTALLLPSLRMLHALSLDDDGVANVISHVGALEKVCQTFSEAKVRQGPPRAICCNGCVVGCQRDWFGGGCLCVCPDMTLSCAEVPLPSPLPRAPSPTAHPQFCFGLQTPDVAQLCGSILVNVTKTKFVDGFRRIIQAGVVNRLVVYCRNSSKELSQLQACVAALANLADAFDISDVLLLEGCPPPPPIIPHVAAAAVAVVAGLSTLWGRETVGWWVGGGALSGGCVVGACVCMCGCDAWAPCSLFVVQALCPSCMIRALIFPRAKHLH
jgi:hypothetical protein